MDEEKLTRFKALITEWQAKLGLEAWEVRATFVASRTDRRADVQIDQFHQQAMIRMNEDEAEEGWPGTIVHELLHIVIHPWSLLTLKFIERLPAGERELAEVWRFQAEEGVVERLAEIVSGKGYFHPNLANSWRFME